MILDPWYFIIIGPAFLLALWAQMRVKSTYHQAQQVPAPISGAGAARHILDSAGLHDVAIEQVQGFLSDHYDPRHKVLRLSPEVYQSRSMAAVGIAAHEAGHAIQDARAYGPLVIRNAVVPLAGIGSNAGIWMFIIGMFLSGGNPEHFGTTLSWAGVALFSTVVFFQMVNLPVEFNASSRAKEQLVSLGIVDQQGLVQVSRVLNAAALTYVAATLQAILTLLYFIFRLSDRR